MAKSHRKLSKHSKLSKNSRNKGSPVSKFRITHSKKQKKSKNFGLSETLYGSQTLKNPLADTFNAHGKEIKKFETKFISSVFQQFLTKNDHNKKSQNLQKKTALNGPSILETSIERQRRLKKQSKLNKKKLKKSKLDKKLENLYNEILPSSPH